MTQSEPPPDSYLTSLRALKNEEARLCLALHSIRLRINTHAPISLLPPELLLHIFSFLTHIDKPYASPPSKWPPVPPTLGWILSTTHVCHHWRHVALAHSPLWTDICTSLSASWAEEMFNRSRGAAVSLSWTVSQGSFLPLDDYLSVRLSEASAFAKIRVLKFAGDASMPANLLVHPVPELKELSLHNSLDFVDLPVDLFSGVAPRLRSVSLLNCSISWGLPILHNLTQLTISLPACTPVFPSDTPVYKNEDVHPGHTQLLTFLRSAKALETLCLTHALPLAKTSLPSGEGSLPVPLPRLKTLELTGRVVDCSRLLKCISFPPTADFVIDCVAGAEAPPGERLRDAIRFLVARMEDAAYEGLPIQGLQVVKEDDLTVSLYVDLPSESCTSTSTSTSRCTNVFTAVFTDSYDDLAHEHSIELMQSLFRPPSMHDRVIDFLSFESQEKYQYISKDDWMAVFFPLRRIRSIEYRGLMLPYSSAAAAYAVTNTPIPVSSSPLPFHLSAPISPDQLAREPRLVPGDLPQENANTLMRPIFPDLRSLKFTDIDFGHGVRREVYAQGFLRDLASQLEGRKRAGVMLEELVIEDPGGVLAGAGAGAACEVLRGLVRSFVIL